MRIKNANKSQPTGSLQSLNERVLNFGTVVDLFTNQNESQFYSMISKACDLISLGTRLGLLWSLGWASLVPRPNLLRRAYLFHGTDIFISISPSPTPHPSPTAKEVVLGLSISNSIYE